MTARGICIVGVACVVIGCKSKPAPVTPPTSIDAATTLDASAMTTPRATMTGDGGSPSIDPKDRPIVVDELAVSSRVDNGTESPGALTDGNLDTAWSSKTGDLVGAWIALRIAQPCHVTAVGMTIGMTKTPDLFTQNVRISEVKITWSPMIGNDRYVGQKTKFGPERTIVEHAALDVTSRDIQKIPVDLAERGILKIVVTKIQPGTKPSWREATVSEVALYDEKGALHVSPFSAHVGALEPLPRGIMHMVPEDEPPLGCLAMLPNAPRLYCFVGGQGTMLSSPAVWAFVTLDRTGFRTIVAGRSHETDFTYGTWLRAERDLAKGGGVTLPTNGVDVAWGKSVVVQGVTFRQRATLEQHADPDAGGEDEGPNDYFNGVVEVEWPGTNSFDELLAETVPPSTEKPPTVTVTQVGSMWLVERQWNHGSEGLVVSGAEDVLCDLAAKKCTEWVAPTAPDPEPAP